jgi:hypothetical protein
MEKNMVTATQQSENADREPRDAMIFERMMEDFFKRWSPDDKYEGAQFHAQLSSLIRRVYMDAQAPLMKQIEVMIRAMPMTPFILKDK